MFRQPFIEGWDFVRILGEGAFGQVKLAMNLKNNSLIAVKIIELKKVQDYKTVSKEISIHKCLKHERIVKYHGCRHEPEEIYVFMEYVSGGELYNLIEPGSPMDPDDCYRFFDQLIEGVEYMHSQGIVHRDIKLENILIDANDNLKITDFGLSTIFRNQENKERMLDRVCGSIPYDAPEVLKGLKHCARPIDIWSCGIILYIMFLGEMPWDAANSTSVEFTRWLEGKFPSSRWGALDKYQLDILRRILNVAPEKRATIHQIKTSNWYLRTGKINLKNSSATSTKESNKSNGSRHFLSQPQNHNYSNIVEEMRGYKIEPNASSSDEGFFSQQLQTDYILATQGVPTIGPSSTDDSNQNTFDSRLTKRLTRFIVSEVSLERLINLLGDALKASDCNWKLITQKCLSVLINDVRGQPLNFKVHIFCPPNGKILVDFRLYRGDGLEFKRIFKAVKASISQSITSLI